jgi:hypothetical protein
MDIPRPSAVLERPATQYMKARAIDPVTIPGYTVQDGHSHIEAPDGTPALRRHIDFSPPDTNGASTALGVASTLLNMGTPGTGDDNYLTVVNPDYGWTGQQSSSGFFDRPPATLGVFASLDRF